MCLSLSLLFIMLLYGKKGARNTRWYIHPTAASQTSPGLFRLSTLLLQISKRLLLTLGLQKDLLQLLCQLNCSCNLDPSAHNTSGSLKSIGRELGGSVKSGRRAIIIATLTGQENFATMVCPLIRFSLNLRSIHHS